MQCIRLGIRTSRHGACWMSGLFVWIAAVAALCQETVSPSAHKAVVLETAEKIDKKLAELESATLDDATKSKVREYYHQAKQELEQHSQWLKQKSAFDQRAATVAERMQRAQRTVDDIKPAWLAPPANATIGELEKLLGEVQAEQKRLEEQVKSLDEEPPRRNARRLEISRDTPTLKQQILDLEAQLAAEPDAGESPVVVQARHSVLAARLQARHSQLAAWEAELAAYEAEKDLLPLERASARARLALVTQAVEQLGRLVAERRSSEVEQRRDRAMRQWQQAPPPLKQEAQKNARWSEQAGQLANDLSRTEAVVANLRSELAQWQERISKLKRRVEKGRSLTHAAALQKDRTLTMERLKRLREEIAARNQRIEQLQEQLEEYQELLDQVADPSATVHRIAEELGFARSPDEEPALRRVLSEVIELRRELLMDMTIRGTRLFELLIEANDTSQDLLKELADHAQFIDRRILWLKSGAAVSLATLRDSWKAVASGAVILRDVFASTPDSWAAIRSELWQNKVMHLACLVVFGLLLRYRRSMRVRLVGLGEIAVRGNCVAFLPTMEALMLTALITLPWPMLVGYLGWRARQMGMAAGDGLVAGAMTYAALEFLRQAGRARGLCVAHFGWPERSVRVVYTTLQWYAPSAALLCLIVVALHHALDGMAHESLGRLVFLLLMALTAWALHRLVRPKGGMFQEYLSYHAGGWAERLTFLWYPALVLGPIVLAGLAIWGYYYTALQLSARGAQTGLLVEFLLILGGLLHRLLLLGRRRLAIQQARQRQQRLQESAEPEAKMPADTTVDLAAINLQSRRLVQSGLVLIGLMGTWLIWADVLPALAILQEIPIYRTESIEVGVIERVTLADLILAVVVVIMTAIAARNIPGLIEILLLQRLPLDSATRYAIATVSRYAIVLAGIIAVCSILGVSWRRAQWLVAALGVGLGFGLQEIFANFVSGLILLFERPIRVGDIITLGDVTGTVTRIRIRATTVRDWDGKELIVPNKDLITGRLLNWTLSDSTNRIVIRVGIAYGSDVRLAQQLLLRVAAEHPAILAEPPPTATFEEFGNSALQLVLRAYLSRLDQRLPCIHDLHLAIDKVFREHNIQIPYPQMEVHVRNGPCVTSGA